MSAHFFSRQLMLLCFLLSIAVVQQGCTAATVDKPSQAISEADKAMSGGTDHLDFAFPEKYWAVRIPKEGLALKVIRKGLEERYMLGEYGPQGLVISAKMLKVPANPAQKQCRDFMWSGEDGSALKKEDIKMTERDGVPAVEYFINEFRGEKIGQKNINAYFAKDDVCVDIHLSKTNYSEKDAALFDSVLKEIAFIDSGDPSVRKFHISENNYLEFKVPALWKTWAQRMEGEQGSVIMATPAEGDGFFIQIQVFGAGADTELKADPEAMRVVVENLKKNIGGAEADVAADIQDLKGTNSVGSFYSIENPMGAQKETPFKYLTRGAATTGDLFAVFTILVKDKDSEFLRSALEMAESFDHAIIFDE